MLYYLVELAITFGVCLVSQYVEAFRNFQLEYWWVMFFPLILLVVTVIVACCVESARKPPLDLVMLLVFVLSFSYLVSMSCSAVVDVVDGPIVPLAIGATVGITFLLTLYAFFCKGNFVIMIGIVIVLIPVLIVLCLMSFFFYLPWLTVAICSIAIVIFGIYLVFITKMIIGGEMEGFPLDTAILASLFLYIYTMRIFLYILMILGAGGGRK